MISQLSAYALAMILGVIAAIIAAFAFLYHRREFWKIAEWEQLRVDQKTLDALGQKLQEMQASLARVANEVSDAEETIRRAGVERVFLDQQPQLEAERVALINGLADVAERTRKAVEELNAAAQRREDILVEINHLLALQKQLKEANELLAANNAQLESQIAALKEAVKEWEKRLKALAEQVGTTTLQLESLGKQLAELETKIKDANERLTDADKRRQESEAKCADAESRKQLAEKRIEHLAAEERSLEATLTNLRKMLEEIKVMRSGTVEIRASAFKQLVAPVLPRRDTRSDLVDAKSETGMLNVLREYVRKSEFAFSDRLLYAFHTALKTADISCLTVMAGVSGTGKSALPKLYADVMGMNFVVLSVEPRWDSPRDLFGFFNYMENRYEPTTLGRALLQFSQSNGGQAGGDLKDQVLMVLLDEMNLARIEYYFSEFLSKLEMRRGARLDDPEEFRKVSIEVFAGCPAHEENPIRLFAGSNVLFVGTMNEDETTQSLSDKVIDRANVIHFGRPQQLRNRAGGANAGMTEGALPLDAWARWKRPADEERLQNEIKRLNDINQILGMIGRPFAHRTFQAILSYLANYPQQDRIPRALADQVAMRVMPKLRGVDLGFHQDLLNRLAPIVADLNDAALMSAFDSAKQSKTGFFQWQGIDWTVE